MNKDLAPAIAEINAILKKHDIMGLVMVTNQTHADWAMHVETSWTCTKFEGNALRIRCKKEEVPDLETRKNLVKNTAGSFIAFVDLMRKMTENCAGILQCLHRAGIEVEHVSKEEPPEPPAHLN
jgi:hypothetical protein